MPEGHLFVISAPSGAGKTSLVRALVQNTNCLKTSISYTTRPMREGEVNGKDYYFIDEEMFFKKRHMNDFLEYAEVFGNFYGTSKEELSKALNKGDDIILEIDWQGAEQIRKSFPDSTDIFIVPPSKVILLDRLTNRGTDSDDVIQRRTEEAIIEMSQYPNFKYLIVNDSFDNALAEIQSVILSFRLQLDRQKMKYSELLSALLD